MRSLILAALGGAAAMLLFIDDAAAKEAGDWIIRAGITHVAPKSNNGSIDDGEGGVINLDVGTATMMTFDGTYMVTNNFGVELLAALPFKHDIKGHADGTNAKLATVKQLPPTLNGNIRYMNIEPDVSVTIPDAGGDVVLKTKVKVNPIVYGLNLGWRF
jgi:outer membrane protein